jgi:hypothetical protein
MIRPRHAAALLTLLLLALVPTIIHSYIGVVSDDGWKAAAIPTNLAGYTAGSDRRDPTWGARRFDSDNWIARRYTRGADEIVLTVVRSYDLKSVYHHPELAIAYDTPFTTSTVERLGAKQIPLHVLKSGNALGLYVLHYDGRFVADPIWFQLRTAGELLFSSRKVMTLFFVQDPVADTSVIEETGALQVLLASINQLTGH